MAVVVRTLYIALICIFSSLFNMRTFLLLILLPSFIAADTLCPNSKTTCPEDKQCCEVDGEHSCCDPDDDHDTPAIRTRVFPGVEMMSPVMYSNATLSANESTLQFGTLCNLLCSPGICCRNGICCPARTICCGDGYGCCKLEFSTCCGSICCATGYRCGPGQTCKSKGSIIYPEMVVLLLLAVSVFVSHRL